MVMPNVLTVASIIVFPNFILPTSGRIGKGWPDLTSKTFRTFVIDNDKVLVDFYDPRDKDWPHHQKELDEALVLVRESGRRVAVAKVDASAEESLAKKYVKNGVYPQLMWFRHGKPTQYHHNFRRADMIAAFVMAVDRPALVKVDKIQDLHGYSRQVLAWTQEKSVLHKALEVVAHKHMETMAFSYLEGKMKNGKEVVMYIDEKKVPNQYTGAQTVEDIEAWVKTLMPRKSEPIPSGEATMDGFSHNVVGDNFEEMVLQKDKDVMLLVHAPWCGHCRQLQPAWNSLGRAVANVPHLMIGKMDGSRNQSPVPLDFTWESYPTIFYVRAGETWPFVYHGNRTMESLIEFANEHASKPLNLDGDVLVDLLDL